MPRLMSSIFLGRALHSNWLVITINRVNDSIGDRRLVRLLHQKTRRRLVLLCGLIGSFLVTANTLKRDYQTLVVLTGAWTRRRLVLTN